MAHTLEELFEGRPDALKLFQTVQKCIESLGPSEMNVTKTQVSWSTGRKFAWVWLPQMWVKAPENSITLAFGLGRKVNDAKIKSVVEPYPDRWTHHIVIKRKEDVDKDVCNWLREAYAFSSERRVWGEAGRRSKETTGFQ